MVRRIGYPITIFIGHNCDNDSPISFMLKKIVSTFLLACLRDVLRKKTRIRLFLFSASSRTFQRSASPVLTGCSSRVQARPFDNTTGLASTTGSNLLIVDRLSCAGLSRRRRIFHSLPSLLIVQEPGGN